MRKHCSHRLQDSDKCETCNRKQWFAWRDDYRCARPNVSCEGCDTFYPSGQSATQMKFDGFRLVFCSECRRREIQKVSQRMQARLEQHLATRANEPPNAKRTIYRDVHCDISFALKGKATRFRQTQTLAMCSKNRYGQIIGQVSAFDRFPKPPPANRLTICHTNRTKGRA